MPTPDSLMEAIKYFSNPDNCYTFMVSLRWADGKVKCPRCGSEHIVYLANAKKWKCYAKHPQPTFTLKTGTIFEDSPIGLDKWLAASWLVLNCKNGISSYEVSRDLQVTQKTAWFMLHRIRLAMQDENTGGKLGGEVEVDETFIGGKARNMHADVKARKIQGTGPAVKAIVAAVLERGGRVRAKVINKRKKADLQSLVRDNVEAGSALFSDALKSYNGLAAEYEHQVVDHAIEYVLDNCHTNSLENSWSLLKRGINGTYISVEPFHLFRYVDEQAFRFNNRILTDGERFQLALKQIVGKRVTYEQLTGKAEHAQS